MTWNERKFVNDVLAQNVKDVLAQNVNDVMLDTGSAPTGSHRPAEGKEPEPFEIKTKKVLCQMLG